MRKALGKLKRGLIGIVHTVFEQTPKPPETPPHILGQSVEGRDIVAYQLGRGPKKVLFVSGMHGNEVGTVKLAYHLIQFFKKPLEFTLYIVPCLNPDGHALALKHPNFLNDGRTGRFNAHGVDLNRNFPTKSFQPSSHWTHGKNYQELTAVFGGETGGSEPEIKALTNFIRKEKIGVYFGFHSAGRDVMGNNLPLAQELAHTFYMATAYRFSPPEEWLALKQTGTTKEWCEEQNIAYVEIEASVRWGSDWRNQKPGISACLELLKRHKNEGQTK